MPLEGDALVLLKLKIEEKADKRKAKLRKMGMDELLINLMRLSIARGRAAEQLRGLKKRDKAGRRQRFLVWKTLSERSDEVLHIASERLGGGVAELNRRMNWRTMVARERRSRQCERCGSTGGFESRMLDFYQGDGPSLTTIVRGENLPSDADIKEALTEWLVLCKTCRKDGV